MGRIGNALKRGLTGDKNKRKPYVGKVGCGCLCSLVILVAVIVCSFVLITQTVKEYAVEVAEDVVTAMAPGGSAASVARQMTIEQRVVNNVQLPAMSEEMKKDALMQIVSVEDLVKGTLSPFGEAGDGDERFSSVTIKTEVVRKVRTHPSADEIARYRSEEYDRMYAAKQQAIIDAINASATPTLSATVTPTPGNTPVPTGSSGGWLGGVKDAVSGALEESRNRISQKSGAGSTAGSIIGNSFDSLNELKNKLEQNTRKPSSKTMPDVTSSSSQNVYAAGKATSPTPVSTPEPTQKPKPTSKPGGSKTPSPSGTKAPGGTAKPTGTPTPIPTPAWDASDTKELDRRVQKYIDDNSKTEEKRTFVDRTVDGEKVRSYLNSFHTPWQSNYSEAAFIAIYDYGYVAGTDTAIQPDVVQRVFEYGNMLEYVLYLDYWANRDYWENGEFLYDERESVFGGEKMAYEDYVSDYSDKPVVLDEHTDLIEEKGFVPLPLFNSISDWAIKTTYGNKTGEYNSYGIPVQMEKQYETSVSFNSFAEGLELSQDDLELFIAGYANMPESTEQYQRLLSVFDMYSPTFYSFGVSISEFAFLTGGDTGSMAAYAALEVAQKGPVYSQNSRESVNAYDCSSLVSRVYESVGISAFRPGYSYDTSALLHYFEDHNLGIVTGGWPDDETVLQPGDVIMWARPASTKYKHVYHTGIWIGDGYIVDASSSLNHVVYRQMWGKNQVVMIARPSLLNLQ